MSTYNKRRWWWWWWRWWYLTFPLTRHRCPGPLLLLLILAISCADDVISTHGTANPQPVSKSTKFSYRHVMELGRWSDCCKLHSMSAGHVRMRARNWLFAKRAVRFVMTSRRCYSNNRLVTWAGTQQSAISPRLLCLLSAVDLADFSLSVHHSLFISS